jgi:hypothetical protein
MGMGLSDKSDTLAKYPASSVHHGWLAGAQDAEWLKAKREEDEEDRAASRIIDGNISRNIHGISVFKLNINTSVISDINELSNHQ